MECKRMNYMYILNSTETKFPKTQLKNKNHKKYI